LAVSWNRVSPRYSAASCGDSASCLVGHQVCRASLLPLGAKHIHQQPERFYQARATAREPRIVVGAQRDYGMQCLAERRIDIWLICVFHTRNSGIISAGTEFYRNTPALFSLC
jgi:hypothetical protein